MHTDKPSRHSDTLTEDAMWTALQNKDTAYDGRFCYGVLSTGIFCRPSCPARLPLRQHVRFYAQPSQAQAAGFRPCKRCRPVSAEPALDQLAPFQTVCRYIEAHPDESLSLETLSQLAGLSPGHFQRRFKAVIGVSPRQYQENCRFNQFKQSLKSGSDVTTATYAAGFGSGSRVYEKLDTRLGMTPGQYRSGGKGLTIAYASADTVAGRLMMGATDRGLCFLQFGANDAELHVSLQHEYPEASLIPMPPASQPQFEQWMQALNAHLQGEQPSLTLPQDLQGTAFQLRVWHYLQSIPYGEVQSYTEVAVGIGQPKAARAVASACAANKLAILVPCHRVIRGNGELGGYRWGLERKRTLIDQERRSRAQAR